MLIKNLKESRKKLDIKQKDVAKLFKVDISTVSGWETGKDMIPLRKLIDYANYFNYSLDYLFGISKENIAYEPLTINLEVIAKNLKRIRKNNNMNQAYVAKRINTKTDFFMTFKKDKENHGFGMKNIVATVEKYHGECYMESIAENGEVLFQISIAIPTAKAEEKKE